MIKFKNGPLYKEGSLEGRLSVSNHTQPLLEEKSLEFSFKFSSMPVDGS